jgi:hypothetical protein
VHRSPVLLVVLVVLVVLVMLCGEVFELRDVRSAA